MVESLFDVVPRLYREFEAALGRVYPDLNSVHLCPFLKFGTWIGGDREGTPRVTHVVTVDAVRLQQKTTLRHYLSRVEQLGGRLSISESCLPARGAAPAAPHRTNESPSDSNRLNPHEPCRSKCRLIAL